jgi:hypothetical protein
VYRRRPRTDPCCVGDRKKVMQREAKLDDAEHQENQERQDEGELDHGLALFT